MKYYTISTAAVIQSIDLISLNEVIYQFLNIANITIFILHIKWPQKICNSQYY